MREEGYIKDIINVILGLLVVILTIIAVLDKGRTEPLYTVLFILGILLSLCNVWKTVSSGRLIFIPFAAAAIALSLICYISLRHQLL